MKTQTINTYFDENKDLNYSSFSAKLIPNIDPNKILGVRVPKIRALVKKLTPSEKEEFLDELPHQYQEENLLHGFILQSIKDFDIALKRAVEFVPYIDNWAVSDTITPKCFGKHKKELMPYIKKWISSNEVYAIRFGIVILMSQFLDDKFEATDIDLVLSTKNEDYYVKMIVAWYLATALSKQYDVTIKYLESKTIEKWTHNKAIQKAIESYRITPEQKIYLRTLKK